MATTIVIVTVFVLLGALVALAVFIGRRDPRPLHHRFGSDGATVSSYAGWSSGDGGGASCGGGDGGGGGC